MFIKLDFRMAFGLTITDAIAATTLIFVCKNLKWLQVTLEGKKAFESNIHTFNTTDIVRIVSSNTDTFKNIQ